MTVATSHRLVPSDGPISRESAAFVRSVYAAFSGLARGGEITSYVATHFDSDCEYRPVEEASAIRGHGALMRWIQRWLEAWQDAWDEIDEIVAAGETVVTAIRVHGRGRKSGVQISQRLFDVFELRDGRVLRVTEYLDRDQAFEAAGVHEPPS
jgi:ketosteroid isomerase-like protein